MMKKIILLLALFAWAGIALAQTKIWEKSAAGANYPSFMGTGNTERGFATGTITLQPFSKIWEKSSAAANYPSFMGTGNTERGFAFGRIGTNDRILLVDRKTNNFVYVLNAATGDSVGVLDTTGFPAMSSGTLRINDADVSSDGIIYACNLALGSGSDTTFRVYRWSNETAAPQLAVSFRATARMGDKFTITGSAAANTLTIWAAGASSTQIVKFITADNGATFTPTTIMVTGAAMGGSASVSPNYTATELYVKSGGQ